MCNLKSILLIIKHYIFQSWWQMLLTQQRIQSHVFKVSISLRTKHIIIFLNAKWQAALLKGFIIGEKLATNKFSRQKIYSLKIIKIDNRIID